MSNAGRAIAFMMLTAGLVIVLVGLGIVRLPSGGGDGGGTTTTTTTSFTEVYGRLVISAVDDQGRALSANIYVNDELVSSNGSADLVKRSGLYRVRWGDVANYRTPPPQDALVTAGEETRVTGVYVPIQTQSYRLTVKVRVCNYIYDVCYWYQGAEVQVGSLYRGETDSNGVVVFNVGAGTYIVTVTTVFGTQTKQVTVNQDIEEVFTYMTSGFSIINTPTGGVEALAMLILILGLIFVLTRRRRR